MQNKCIRFCLELDKMCTISHKKFNDLNWLPVTTRFEQCVISITFKFINGNCPYYLNGFFEFAPEGSISLRSNFLKLKQPFWNTNAGQKALSFIGVSLWNQIPETLKKTESLNTFKHSLNKHFFNQMTWFLLTLPLSLILLFIIIIQSSNITNIIATFIAIIIILLLLSLVMLLSSILLLLYFPLYSPLHFYCFCWETTMK